MGYVFQKLELGRRELSPEWKVDWDCSGNLPRPMYLFRKLVLVAYAEFCGSAEYVSKDWPRIVTAAISAGVEAGIATIIAAPSAALPVFKQEFDKHLRGGGSQRVNLEIALSAQQEANGPWCIVRTPGVTETPDPQSPSRPTHACF